MLTHLRGGLVNDFDVGVADEVADGLGKLQHGVLVGVANVDGVGKVRVHEADETFDKVADVLKRARLVAIAVHGHVLALKRLEETGLRSGADLYEGMPAK
jgi:hypothetical protein